VRVGIFGGTFDPVHYGHLLLAECCREQCHLNEVWFVPAAIPPHKRHRDLSESKHRIEMLRLATGGHDAFRVSRMEVDRGGVSYTVDTLRQMHAQHPEAEFYLLLGADSLADFPNWREPAEILRLAMPVVVRRGSATINWTPLAPLVSAERFAQFAQHIVEMPVVDFSSTAIREAVASGRGIRYRTPRAVEEYIRSHGLYREATGKSRGASQIE
jgi:nicotinate-nucleotide adenylyltransferase